MAVTSVRPASMGSSGNASGTSGSTVKAAYRAAWRVQCSSPADTVDEVLHHFRITSSLPWMGRKFKFGNGFNASLFCNDLQADQVEKSDGQFIATAKFESLEPQQPDDGQTNSGQNSDNPFLWHDEIHVTYQSVSIPAEQAILFGSDPLGVKSDILKKGYKGPVQNSAGDPYDTALDKEARIKILRITKYSPDYDDGVFEPYMNAINNDVLVINKPQYNFSMRIGLYRCKFGNADSAFGITNGIKFYKTTVELLISKLPYGWLKLVQDKGPNKLQTAGKKDDFGETISEGAVSLERKHFKTPHKDDFGIPTGIQPLDGNGEPLEPGKQPVYFIWQVEELKPFAPLTLLL